MGKSMAGNGAGAMSGAAMVIIVTGILVAAAARPQPMSSKPYCPQIGEINLVGALLPPPRHQVVTHLKR
jgi:hypothetical protein